VGDGYRFLSYGVYLLSLHGCCVSFKKGVENANASQNPQIHQNMVPLRPEVHCPHIGPSGGGMCVDDRTYIGNLEENYFVNTPFLAPGLEGGVFS
jgi:hypothetical protein